MPDRRTWKPGALYLSAIATIGVISLIVLVLPPQLRIDPVRMLLLGLMTGAALLFAGAAWRRTDEAAREAHKVAALWGSSFGLLVGLLGLGIAAIALVPQHLVRNAAALIFSGEMPVERIIWMLNGAMIVSAASVFGYALIWAAWWLRKPREHHTA